MVWDGYRVQQVRRFLVWTIFGLLTVHLLQIVVAFAFGAAGHDFVFLIERENWQRMWTPFTSAVAHSPNGHLAVNMMGFLVFGPPLAATVGAGRAIGILYAGAVLGQLFGIMSGKGDLMGASAGVMAAASASVVTAPLWIGPGRAWANAAWHEFDTLVASGRRLDGLVCLMALFLVVVYPGVLVYAAGIQLKTDLQGASIFATYPWGAAPPGTGYTSHLFGFAFGAAAGVFILVHAAWRHINRESDSH